MNGRQPKTFVKICGITREEEATAAAHAGADAVGFVFADGPRKVSLERAAEISAGLHSSVRRIGVFVDADFFRIQQHVEAAGLDGVQLHGSEAPALVERLKSSHPDLMVFKAIKMNGRESADAAEVFAGQVDALMFDRKDVTRPERRVDPLPLEWLKNLPFPRIILAGGLSPENVGEAVKSLRPWGVDASGGLEIRPGTKDPGKVTAFVRAVRQAEYGSRLRRPDQRTG